jgi:hypothetical protein
LVGTADSCDADSSVHEPVQGIDRKREKPLLGFPPRSRARHFYRGFSNCFCAIGSLRSHYASAHTGSGPVDLRILSSIHIRSRISEILRIQSVRIVTGSRHHSLGVQNAGCVCRSWQHKHLRNRTKPQNLPTYLRDPIDPSLMFAVALSIIGLIEKHLAEQIHMERQRLDIQLSPRRALTLQEELDGHRDYAQRVRYRLLPGAW